MGEDAYKGFEQALLKAIDAYNSAQNDLKRISSTNMKMFCHVVIVSYEKNQKHFVPFPQLPSEKKELVASLIKNEVELLLKDLKNVKKRTGITRFFKSMTMEWNEIEE